MKNNLLAEFEQVLNIEANRIFIELVNMYNNRVIVNKDFPDLVGELMKDEFDYYFVEIELRIYGLMGNKYALDPTNEYALISMQESVEKHLVKYTEFCIKNDKKNHIKAAEEMANFLIEFSKRNPLSESGLTELVANNMQKLFPSHNDSVDSRAMILYLQSKIEDKGYTITSLQPFRMIAI